MATYSDGTTTSINTGITWNSSDTSVATIDNDGLATVVGSTGTTNITATYNNITSNQATLTVAIKTIKAIAITPLVSVINAGLTQQYTARVIYSDNESSPIDTGITWQSTDKSVATIDNNGLATVIASAGTTCITANWSGVVSNVAILTATDKTAVSISISPRSVNLPIESTQQYSVEVNYSDGSSSSINTEITWNSSDSSVATIDKNTGLATVVASTGTTNITANWHGMQDSTTLTAIDKLISISIIPSDTILMNQNDKLQFKAQGTYFSGIISDVTSLVNWHSTVPSVVTINPVGLAIAGTIGGEVSYIYADSLDKRIRSNITQVVVHY